jgi:hypothetical protein
LKKIFLSSWANSLDDIRSKMQEIMASGRLSEFLAKHPYDKERDIPAKVCSSIVREVEEWLATYNTRGPEWFNDETQYSKAVRELSELEKLATGKMDYYLETGIDVQQVPMEKIALY